MAGGLGSGKGWRPPSRVRALPDGRGGGDGRNGRNGGMDEMDEMDTVDTVDTVDSGCATVMTVVGFCGAQSGYGRGAR